MRSVFCILFVALAAYYHTSSQTLSWGVYNPGTPNPGGGVRGITIPAADAGYVLLGDLGTQTTEFSVAMWVKPAAQRQSYAVLVDGNHGNVAVLPNANWVIQSLNAGATWGFLGATFTLQQGQWQHLLCTYGDGKAKVYVNGTLVSQANWSLVWGAAAEVYIGNWPLGGRRFHGEIDEVIVTRNVLYTSNFSPNNRYEVSDLPANTLGLWHFDEGSGTTTTNSYANQTNSVTNWEWITRTLENEPCSTVTIQSQPLGATVSTGQTTTISVAAASSGGTLSYQWQRKQGAYFVNLTNGTDYQNVVTSVLTVTSMKPELVGTYRCVISTATCVVFTAECELRMPTDNSAAVKNPGTPNPGGGVRGITIPAADAGYVLLGDLGTQTTAFSVAMWVKPAAQRQGYAVLVDGNHGNVAVLPNANWVVQSLNSGATWGFLGANFTLQQGQWQHLLCTYGDGQAKVYVNGTLVSQAAWNLVWGAAAEVYIGNWPLGGRRFHGEIDEVIVTRNVMHSSNFTPKSRYELADLPANALGLWHFDEGGGQTVANAIDQSTYSVQNWQWVTRGSAITCNLVVRDLVNQTSVAGGHQVQLAVTSTSSPSESVSYQWQVFNGSEYVALSNSPDVSGSTTSVLTLNSARLSKKGPYRCVVSTATCSVVTNPTELNVTCPCNQ
jgi:hypothetical protein